MKIVIFISCVIILMSNLWSLQVTRDMVILENFGGTWCVACPGAAMGAEDLVANGHDVAVIEYHVWDDYDNDFFEIKPEGVKSLGPSVRPRGERNATVTNLPSASALTYQLCLFL